MKILYYYEVFRKAIKLNVLDLGHEFSSELIGFVFDASDSYKKGIINRSSAFIYHMFKAFKDLLRLSPARIPPQAVLFWTLSKNETDCLQPICSIMPEGYLIDNSNREERKFPWFFAYAISVLFCPFLILIFIRSQGFKRRSFRWALDYYWCSYGLYIVGRLWIHFHKPKAIIFSNLLHPYHRVLQESAKDEGCVNIYVQHASLMDNMPPFTCDYALLEGKDALAKATDAGIEKAKVFIIGMPKYDAYVHQVNFREKVEAVGFCTNDLDPLSAATELLSQLHGRFPMLSVILRPHNGDRRTLLWKELAQKYNIIFSDSRIEFSFEFLKKVDAVIAGDSNILMEAALINVVPIYFDFCGKHLDWYGFYKNGLVDYISEPNDVCNYLSKIMKEKPNVRTKAKYYNAAINTNIDGHSAKIAAELIQIVVSGNQIDYNKWHRITVDGIEAYEYAGCESEYV